MSKKRRGYGGNKYTTWERKFLCNNIRSRESQVEPYRCYFPFEPGWCPLGDGAARKEAMA